MADPLSFSLVQLQTNITPATSPNEIDVTEVGTTTGVQNRALIAISGDGDGAGATTVQSTTTTLAATTSAAPTTTAAPVPTKIISMSPTATEMLYAIGAGDQVLAVVSDDSGPALRKALLGAK